MSRKIHIGLDFGTYQSKACFYQIDQDAREFYKFSGSNSYFLPSSILINEDQSLRIGETSKGSGKDQLYRYFKIASAEDDSFRLETFDQQEDNNFYRFNEFKKYSPEVLSVLYLTYIILEIEQNLRKRFSGGERQGGALLRGLFQRQNKVEEIHFTYRLGIPTEWSQKKTIERKRKFENILLLARLLSKSFASTQNYLNNRIDELLIKLKSYNLNQQIGSIDEFKLKLNEEGVSVYPETAAGLALITQEQMVRPGCYATMDIGGGSTDISFFRVFSDYKIIYFASESYLLACNNIYLDYIGRPSNSIEELESAENEVIAAIKDPNWISNSRLVNAIEHVDEALDKKLYKLFFKRVCRIQDGFRHEFNNKDLIIYGGGSTIPKLNDGSPIIHDNGARNAANLTTTRMTKRPVGDLGTNLDMAGDDKSWRDQLNLLVVALGLSYLNPDFEGEDWIDDSMYMPTDDGSNGLEPHPFNEGMFIYNVYKSTWD